jgi:hypothetical protein
MRRHNDGGQFTARARGSAKAGAQGNTEVEEQSRWRWASRRLYASQSQTVNPSEGPDHMAGPLAPSRHRPDSPAKPMPASSDPTTFDSTPFATQDLFGLSVVYAAGRNSQSCCRSLRSQGTPLQDHSYALGQRGSVQSKSVPAGLLDLCRGGRAGRRRWPVPQLDSQSCGGRAPVSSTAAAGSDAATERAGVSNRPDRPRPTDYCRGGATELDEGLIIRVAVSATRCSVT